MGDVDWSKREREKREIEKMTSYSAYCVFVSALHQSKCKQNAVEFKEDEILENLYHAPTVLASETGTILSVNRAALKLFGYERY
jgi:hypothetical protein